MEKPDAANKKCLKVQKKVFFIQVKVQKKVFFIQVKIQEKRNM